MANRRDEITRVRWYFISFTEEEIVTQIFIEMDD